MKIKYLIPSTISISGLILSCIIVLMILMHPDLRNYPHVITLAGLLFLFALLIDGFDGISARLLHAESNFGCFLDTYMDFFTYAVLPAILFLQLFGHTIFNYVIFIYIIVMGACRLSKFHTTRVETGPGTFMGLPITLNALWVVLGVFLLFGDSVFKGFFAVHFDVIYWIFVIPVVILCLLQIVNIEYPKSTKNPIVMILAILFAIAGFTPFDSVKTYLAAFMSLYVLYFVVSGFVITIRKK